VLSSNILHARNACNPPGQNRLRRLRSIDYFHRLGGPVPRPPSHNELQHLRKHSSSCNIRKLRYRPPRSQGVYLSIVTPTLPAIKLLEELYWRINYGEIAHDFEDPNRSLEPILRKYFIHPYQRVFYRKEFKGTWYTAKRSAVRNFVSYREEEAGEWLHFECRLRKEALKATGLHKAADLTMFDFEEFWQGELQFRSMHPDYRQGVEDLATQQVMLANRNIQGKQRDKIFPRQRLVPWLREWELEELPSQDIHGVITSPVYNNNEKATHHG
jgi:hypothetical protein